MKESILGWSFLIHKNYDTTTIHEVRTRTQLSGFSIFLTANAQPRVASILLVALPFGAISILFHFATDTDDVVLLLFLRRGQRCRAVTGGVARAVPHGGGKFGNLVFLDRLDTFAGQQGYAVTHRLVG